MRSEASRRDTWRVDHVDWSTNVWAKCERECVVRVVWKSELVKSCFGGLCISEFLLFLVISAAPPLDPVRTPSLTHACPWDGPRGRKRYRHLHIYMLAQIRLLHCTISSLVLRRSAMNQDCIPPVKPFQECSLLKLAVESQPTKKIKTYTLITHFRQ